MFTEPISANLVVLAISVDLDGDASPNSQDWLHLFKDYELPATWCIAEPAQSPLARVIAGEPSHELALLGESNWVGEQIERMRFSRELERRLREARAEELHISTLALRETDLRANLDLLVKNRISALRSDQLQTRSQRLVCPQSQRFGIWRAAISYRLPSGGQGHWWSGDVGVIRKRLRRAAEQEPVMHLAIDGRRFNQQGGPASKTLNQVLQYLAARRREGVLHVETLGELAARYSQNPPQGAKSILQAA